MLCRFFSKTYVRANEKLLITIAIFPTKTLRTIAFVSIFRVETLPSVFTNVLMTVIHFYRWEKNICQNIRIHQKFYSLLKRYNRTRRLEEKPFFWIMCPNMSEMMYGALSPLSKINKEECILLVMSHYISYLRSGPQEIPDDICRQCCAHRFCTRHCFRRGCRDSISCVLGRVNAYTQ
jgi:hypothetical protein